MAAIIISTSIGVDGGIGGIGSNTTATITAVMNVVRRRDGTIDN